MDKIIQYISFYTTILQALTILGCPHKCVGRSTRLGNWEVPTRGSLNHWHDWMSTGRQSRPRFPILKERSVPQPSPSHHIHRGGRSKTSLRIEILLVQRRQANRTQTDPPNKRILKQNKETEVQSTYDLGNRWKNVGTGSENGAYSKERASTIRHTNTQQICTHTHKKKNI